MFLFFDVATSFCSQADIDLCQINNGIIELSVKGSMLQRTRMPKKITLSIQTS